MSWQPLDVIGGAYNDDAKPWSAQDTVNYLPVAAEAPGTRSMKKLVGVPGLNPFSAGMQEAPVRGLHDVEGLLLAVTGNKLYRVRPDGIAIPLGTIPGYSRVSMAHNQIKNGYEVMIATGQGGYVYNTVTDTLTQVTDEGFPGMLSADYVDGYIAGVEPQGRFWFHSDLRQAMEYNTLDRYDAESAPDKIVSLVVSHREVMVLGARSGAFFRNTGAVTGTFQNSNGMEIDVGVANPYCAAVVDNTVYWLGNDGLVYQLQGHSPVIISTGPLAAAMSRLDLTRAFCTVWADRKHKVFYLTFPDGQTWGYDAWTKEWHRRQSYGMERWRVSALCQSAGIWYAGDYTNGRLYKLDWDLQAEADQPLVRRRVTGVIHADQNEVVVNALELVFDVGQPTVEPDTFPNQPDGPTIAGDAPDSVVSSAYPGFAYTLTGDAPLTVTKRSGALPTPLVVSSTGTIGTQVTPVVGVNPFRLRVTDKHGLFAELNDSIAISAYSIARGETTAGSVGYATSASGTAWTSLTIPIIPDYLGATDTRFFFFGSGSVYYSDDYGITLTASTGYAGGGSGGNISLGWSGTVVLVTDGITGIRRSTDRGNSFSAQNYPAYPRSNYICFTKSAAPLGIVASIYLDEVSITNDLGLTYTTGGDPKVRYVFGGGIGTDGDVICVAGCNVANDAPKCAFTSDGLAFSERAFTGSAATFVVAMAVGIVASVNRWIFGMDNGELWWTEDRVTMHKFATGLGVPVKDIQWNGAYFLIAGDNIPATGTGVIKYSVDGENLITATSPLAYRMYDIATLQP